MATGLEVSKVVSYTVVELPDRLSVSKMISYTVIQTITGPTGETGMERLMRHGTYFMGGSKKPMWWAK